MTSGIWGTCSSLWLLMRVTIQDANFLALIYLLLAFARVGIVMFLLESLSRKYHPLLVLFSWQNVAYIIFKESIYHTYYNLTKSVQQLRRKNVPVVISTPTCEPNVMNIWLSIFVIKLLHIPNSYRNERTYLIKNTTFRRRIMFGIFMFEDYKRSQNYLSANMHGLFR